LRIAGFWRFVRFRDGAAGNGDVATPGWTCFWGVLRIFIQRCIGEMGDCLGELRHRVDLLI
jgi:hypothetical protein